MSFVCFQATNDDVGFNVLRCWADTLGTNCNHATSHQAIFYSKVDVWPLMCPMIVMHVPWAHDDGETGVEVSMQVLTQKN